jgi:hypothetical protein
MVYVRRSYDLGAYVANEESMTMVAANYGGGGPVVLVIPGVSAAAWSYNPAGHHPNWWRGVTLLAGAGAVVCAGTFADAGDGGSSWGNQPGRDRMDLALGWLATVYDADTSRVAIIGDSEGGDLGLNYAWRHTSTVKALVTRLTPPDVQALYAVNGIVQATVDSAFDTLGGWPANRETHDPSSATNLPLVAAIAERVRMYYSSNDGLAPQAAHETFAAATGVEIVPVGAVEHDIGTTGAVHAEDQAAWIWSRLTA